MNVLVMGAGGVGGYFGALLARGGHRVTVVARGAHLDALQQNGLRVESAVEPSFGVPVHALSSAEPGVVADLVLFAVKTYDSLEAIDRIQPSVGADTAVLTLQNGVDSGELLARHFGAERVLEGAVYIESHVRAPGIVAQEGGPRRVIFGRRSGNGERETTLLDAFKAAGWQAELAPHVLRTLWTKLSFLGPFATLNAITGLRADQLCSQDACSMLVHGLIAEYAAVGNAEGAELPPDIVETSMERVRTFTGTSSMLRDRLAGKRLESDSLVGSVVDRGAARGVPTPLAGSLACLISPMRDGGAATLV